VAAGGQRRGDPLEEDEGVEEVLGCARGHAALAVHGDGVGEGVEEGRSAQREVGIEETRERPEAGQARRGPAPAAAQDSGLTAREPARRRSAPGWASLRRKARGP
jgi:hypothetical protein